MKHGTRTRHRDSKQTYCQEPGDTKIAGKTEGKADVACIWSLLSQTIIRVHPSLHQDMILYSTDRKRKIERNNDAFVNNCDGVASKSRQTFRESEKATNTHLQKGAQIWEDQINASRGAISFLKSGWQMPAFDDLHFPLIMKEIPSGNNFLKDAFGSKSKIKKMSINTPNKGLVCHQAVTGSMDKEYTH